MPKKKVITKKKGPKGKKARKAAKLERQWGEETNEDEIRNARIRKGKRRLTASSRMTDSGKKLKLQNRRDVDVEEWDGNDDDDGRKNNDGVTEDSDASSVESDDDIDEEGINEKYGFSSLMKNIRNGGKKTKSLKKKVSIRNNDDDDDSDEEGSISSNGDVNDETSESSNSEAGDDDDDNDVLSEGNDSEKEDDKNDLDYDMKTLKPIGVSHFHSHFKNREPLPEKSAMDISPDILKMKRCKYMEEQLNTNLILQLSSNSLEMVQKKNDNDAETNTTNKLSQHSFSHVNRTLLSNWNNMNRRSLRKKIDSDENNVQEKQNGKKDKDTEKNKRRKNTPLTPLQDCIYGPMSTYSDSLITCESRKNRDAINNVVVLHIINHVLTANHDITTHNNQIRDMKAEESDDDTSDQLRDQGYTRPKVLVLLPTRSTAYRFVSDILKLIGAETDTVADASAGTKSSSLSSTSTVENLERFDGEFGNFDEVPEQDERLKGIFEAKGRDWNELFADHVNSDDDFKIGLSFSKKKAKKSKSKQSDKGGGGVTMKIYSDFYHSDIIIASPLGLKMTITNDEEEEADADFLSSIEIIASLQSDVMFMQNWDHFADLMERINQQPKKSNQTDFSRVRNYLLLGQAARWRQFIMVSRFSDPQLLSAFNRNAKSIVGRMKLRRKVPADEASICNVITKVRQVFQRVPCDSFATQGDKRIKYFTNVLLPQLLRTKQKHTLLYIPSYFDFVALRNILLKHDLASSHFVSVTEYSRGTEVNRGRARFLQGRKRLMLYTGRAHFFMRHHIKGAKHLIMFGLPEHAEFYPELLNMLAWRPRSGDDEVEEYQLDMSAPSSCLNLFTKYEAHSLERIVGTKHSDRMIKGEKNTFLFHS